jgi:hypothetical protein
MANSTEHSSSEANNSSGGQEIYVIRVIITVVTRVHHQMPSWSWYLGPRPHRLFVYDSLSIRTGFPFGFEDKKVDVTAIRVTCPTHLILLHFITVIISWLITVAARSKAWTVFARSEAGIVGSNPTQGMDVLCVYAFIPCLCRPVFR